MVRTKGKGSKMGRRKQAKALTPAPDCNTCATHQRAGGVYVPRNDRKEEDWRCQSRFLSYSDVVKQPREEYSSMMVGASSRIYSCHLSRALGHTSFLYLFVFIGFESLFSLARARLPEHLVLSFVNHLAVRYTSNSFLAYAPGSCFSRWRNVKWRREDLCHSISIL